MRNAYLILAVSAAGAAVLAVELLGTRILGPFYGVSLYLWSALITVTLAALSIGYLLGGIVADRAKSPAPLHRAIGLAGLWIILVPWIRHPFLYLAEPLGLRIAVLTAAFVLFFPPLMLLGMVNPMAIKLRAMSLDTIGRTAGTLSFVSTLSSVLAALVTGFILIPEVGVDRLTILTGVVCLAVAVIGMITGRRSVVTTIVLLAVLAGGTFSYYRWGEAAVPERGLIDVRQSPYGELRIVDNPAGRHLLIDGGIHTLVDTSTWESQLHYTAVMEIPKYFFRKPGSALILGLGGGMLARQYEAAGWKVDCVEVDPAVAELARKYFGFRGSTAIADGRQYFQRIPPGTKYDCILLDIYGSSSIPFHLVTAEAFGIMREKLRSGGILAVNLETIGWHDPIIASIAATLRTSFGSVTAYPIAEPPDRFGNIILLASDAPMVPCREPDRNPFVSEDWRYGPGYQIVHAWDNRFEPVSTGKPFTDDLNPVDIQSERINLASRKELHGYFGQQKISW